MGTNQGLNAISRTSDDRWWHAAAIANKDEWSITAMKATTDLIALKLLNGELVPVSVAGQHGGHAMLMTDARDESGVRRFLISDPYSGRTAWVSETDIVTENSNWAAKYFHVQWPHLTHYYEERALSD